MKNKSKIFKFTIIIYLLFVNNANAYLDPGSASLVLQGILAGIVGGIATLGIYWSRFKQFLKNMFTNRSSDRKLNKNK